MSLTNVDCLEDRVRIRFHLSRPDGISDEHGVIEILYESMPDLPRPPSQVGEGYNYHVDVNIPKLNRPITFIIDTYCESSGGPNEEHLYGPYLKEREAIT